MAEKSLRKAREEQCVEYISEMERTIRFCEFIIGNINTNQRVQRCELHYIKALQIVRYLYQESDEYLR